MALVSPLPSTATMSATGSQSGSSPGLVAVPPAFSQFKNGVVELSALKLTPPVLLSVPCEGRAVLISKLPDSTANGVCPPEWVNISCSCVETNETSARNKWIFNLKRKDENATMLPVPTAVDPSMKALEIDTIGQLMLPKSVVSVRLLSVSANKVTNFDLDLISSIRRDGKTVSLITTESENFVKEVEVADIDLSNVEITQDFLPPSVTNLTLRNCNLDSLPSIYLGSRWDKLLNVDLSGNSLSTWFGGEMAAVPQATFGTINTLNLSGNKYKTVPSSILGMSFLETLNFSNNPITNMTMNQALFDKIAKLKSFSFSGIDTSTLVSDAACGNHSVVKTAHNVSFCVVRNGDQFSTVKLPGPEEGSHTSDTLLIVGILGGVVIVLLAAALFTMRRRRRIETRQHKFTIALDGEAASTSVSREFDSMPMTCSNRTLSLGHASDTGDPMLLSDPMIITSRVDHKDLRFGELLKQGGFGMVFSGVYKRRRVAIKKIRSEFCMDAKLVDSFLKEIALMASLSHPRIVEYIGCAWDHVGNLSMVTELMSRGDLREVLQYHKQRQTPLSWSSHKMRMALHIAEGLRYLHTLSPKVIHRDLKSKNVLVSDDLEAKLTDFGISREGRFEQTHMTAGIGTSFWIAPEVLAGVRYDERADIFSFGVVLSEIDTDDYPYWNDSNERVGAGVGAGAGAVGEAQDRDQTHEVGILWMVLNGELRPQFTAECPQEIRFLADRCLEGEPSKRPSANEIVEYLMAVIDGPANE